MSETEIILKAQRITQLLDYHNGQILKLKIELELLKNNKDKNGN